MNEYEQRAISFLERNNAKLTITKVKKTALEEAGKSGLFAGDPDHKKHNKYRFTITTPRGSYWSIFWDSVNSFEQGTTPNEYDILSCLGVDYSEDFKDFCNYVGYDEYIEDDYGRMIRNAKVFKTYEAVRKQSKGLQRVFTDQQLDELSEIE